MITEHVCATEIMAVTDRCTFFKNLTSMGRIVLKDFMALESLWLSNPETHLG